ncbi:hypothetical protein [Streptomyces sclerotialus]|uniref:hypothetical protein n=1 Tax=Streptomyces sclerotialus TaxID=1957 RepID=UPI00056BDF99
MRSPDGGTAHGRARNVAETAVWWAALFALWTVLITTVDPLETLVGAAVSLVGAVAAGAARRAVTDR